MEEIKKIELEKIEGGLSIWAYIGIAALAIFGIGVFDGFVRPLKCNS